MHSFSPPMSRFLESMKMNYEKWRDGIGYDLEALKKVNQEELDVIENIIINRDPLDWRDIEVLAILDTPKARTKLKTAVLGGIHRVNMAILDYAPGLVDNELKTKKIIDALRSATFFYGLRQTLNIVEKYHPEEVVRELFHGLLNREGGVAVNFAAMLFYLHGKAETSFDWELRSFFLKFNTDQLSERKIMFQELCKRINVDYREYL